MEKTGDFGKIYLCDGKKMLNFVALPYPLPDTYKSTLVDLGRACIKAGKEITKAGTPKQKAEATKAYNKLVEGLKEFELHLRMKMGIEVTRKLNPMS